MFLLVSCQASPSEQTGSDSKPAGSTTYDQRQTGKYNVHVNIKDVQFFSLSDSLASIGDYGDYGDYADLEGGFGEPDDYDSSHLTVNPIFAFLGSKPTTSKPITTTAAPTTEKQQQSSTSEASTEKASTSTTTIKQDSQNDSTVYVIKPASVGDKTNETIDYEEIPVEVQYYRGNHNQKLASNGRHAASNRFYKRQPSVQIIDGHGRANNVKIMENDHPTVKICNRGEFRDNLGRCRVRTRRGAPL